MMQMLLELTVRMVMRLSFTESKTLAFPFIQMCDFSSVVPEWALCDIKC